MANLKYPYLHLGKKPRKDDIVAIFRVVPQGSLSLKEAAQELAAESSVGTWTAIGTLKENIFRKLAARVIFIDKKKKIVRIAYPLALFEKGNISQLLATVAGNIFSMKKIRSLRLEDIIFPDAYINSFPGPQIGLDGTRKKYKIYKRPIIGCIIKPKVGLSPKETANICYKVFENGVDMIKDDETLTDMLFSRFEKRVREIIKARRLAEKETKKKKVYVFNVTSPAGEMLKRARLVKKMGGRCIMVDIITVGFSGLQYLRKQNLGLIIHGHRAGHGALTDDISMLIIAKLARLSGIDELHTGTVIGKMQGSKEEILEINNFLRSRFGKLKKVLPVASGGLHPGMVDKLIKILGKNLIINFGGGIHGHPKGSAWGARAVFQSIEAAARNIPLRDFAKTHRELSLALKHWKNGKRKF